MADGKRMSKVWGWFADKQKREKMKGVKDMEKWKDQSNVGMGMEKVFWGYGASQSLSLLLISKPNFLIFWSTLSLLHLNWLHHPFSTTSEISSVTSASPVLASLPFQHHYLSPIIGRAQWRGRRWSGPITLRLAVLERQWARSSVGGSQCSSEVNVSTPLPASWGSHSASKWIHILLMMFKCFLRDRREVPMIRTSWLLILL